SIDFHKRIGLASTLTRLFEINNRDRSARRLCLDFYDSIALILDDEQLDPPSGPPYDNVIGFIEQGKRKEAVAAMNQFIQNASGAGLHPCLSLLALKSDDMPLAYRLLFEDFSNQKLTPCSLYMIAILAAREKRFIESEHFMLRAQKGIHSPTLERWLLIDLAKISMVNNKTDEARAIAQKLLQNNPQDPQALHILIFSRLADNKDWARQQLAQLINVLYPDPYLIAETAKLAIHLMEMETAAQILEQFEPKIEPNHDFYEVFAFVRQTQGRLKEADELLNKARQIHDSRVSVTSAALLNHQLKEAVDLQEQRRQEIESLQNLDALSKAYYCLLDEDYKNALSILQHENASPYEQFILSAVQRRAGRLRDAQETLLHLKTDFPQFHSYEVLSLLADLNARLGNKEKAVEFSQEILEKYPQSCQASVAQNAVSNPNAIAPENILQPIQSSCRMSPYENYAAPFILTEILEHWGDDASFAYLTNLLRVSPRRGVLFHEFVTLLASVTRHQVIPFTGTRQAVLNCLQQKIPVVFCQGDMFDGQLITQLTLLVGADLSRGQFYAESIAPFNPHLFTEIELLEGVCFAIFPSSLEPDWSPEMDAAIQRGKEYIKLHLEASHLKSDPDHDAAYFLARQQSILGEKDRSFLPHQLAFLRWTIKNKPGAIAKQYLDALEASGASSSYYWFLAAMHYSSQKNPDAAQTCLQKALDRQCNSPRYRLAQVRILDQMQRVSEAVQLAEILRDEYPENELVSYQLLLLYKKTGQTEQEKFEEERLKKRLHVDSIQIDAAQDETQSTFVPSH
ncbi:MAG: tetratricopeptide repeat protein, partial [Candidatus Hinthialibacter sp.]